MDFWAPIQQCLIQEVWGEAQEFPFLTSWQVRQALLDQGPHFESPALGQRVSNFATCESHLKS